MPEGGFSIWRRLTSFMFQYCQWPKKATQKSKLRAKNQEYFMNYDIMNDVLGYTLSVYMVHSSHIYFPLVSSLGGPVRFCLAYFHHVFDYGKNPLHIRALALKNFNAILFYNSKKLFYHYTIPFYNIFTSQTSTSLFYSLK